MALAVLNTNDQADAAATRCNRVGEQRIVQGVREVCRPVGGQFIWVRSSTPATTTTTARAMNATTTTRATSTAATIKPRPKPRKPIGTITSTTATRVGVASTTTLPPSFDFAPFGDFFASRPIGVWTLWKNPTSEPYRWSVTLSHSAGRGNLASAIAQMTTFISHPSGNSFGICTNDVRDLVRYTFDISYDEGRTISHTGDSTKFTQVNCAYLGLGVVPIWDSRSGVNGYYDWQSDAPASNLDQGVLVDFWIRITGEHPHVGFKTESGWIHVDLRNWPYR